MGMSRDTVRISGTALLPGGGLGGTVVMLVATALTPAAGTECGVSSGASEFGDVAGAAARG